MNPLYRNSASNVFETLFIVDAQVNLSIGSDSLLHPTSSTTQLSQNVDQAAQAQLGQQNRDHAKIRFLQSIRTYTDRSSIRSEYFDDSLSEANTLNVPDLSAPVKAGNINRQDEHNSFGNYYKKVINNTYELAKEIGVETSSILLTDPTHELPDLEMISPIPKDFETLRTRYSETKKEIADKIGFVGESIGEVTNRATNEIELYIDSVLAYSSFFKLVNILALKVNGRACFGPDDDLQILKGEESFYRKFEEDTKKLLQKTLDREGLPSPDLYPALEAQVKMDVVKCLADVVRGTIIIDSIEQMRSLIKHIVEVACNSVHIRGAKFKNIWSEIEPPRPDGYVSMHVKVGIAYENEIGETRTLTTEIQLQFSSFFDGTHNCTKELMHVIMDYDRRITSGKIEINRYTKELANAASMLQMLLFMKTLKNSIFTQPDATATLQQNSASTQSAGGVGNRAGIKPVNQAEQRVREMVARRSPLKHILRFLTAAECTQLAQTCNRMAHAESLVAKLCFEKLMIDCNPLRLFKSRRSHAASEHRHQSYMPHDIPKFPNLGLMKDIPGYEEYQKGRAQPLRDLTDVIAFAKDKKKAAYRAYYDRIRAMDFKANPLGSLMEWGIVYRASARVDDAAKALSMARDSNVGDTAILARARDLLAASEWLYFTSTPSDRPVLLSTDAVIAMTMKESWKTRLGIHIARSKAPDSFFATKIGGLFSRR